MFVRPDRYFSCQVFLYGQTCMGRLVWAAERAIRYSRHVTRRFRLVVAWSSSESFRNQPRHSRRQSPAATAGYRFYPCRSYLITLQEQIGLSDLKTYYETGAAPEQWSGVPIFLFCASTGLFLPLLKELWSP